MKIRQTMFRFPLSVLTHRYMATNTFQGTHRVLKAHLALYTLVYSSVLSEHVNNANFNRAGLFSRLFWSLAVITIRLERESARVHRNSALYNMKDEAGVWYLAEAGDWRAIQGPIGEQ